MDFLTNLIDSSGDESYVPEDDNNSGKASDLSDTSNNELGKSDDEESPVCKRSAVAGEKSGLSNGQQPDRSDTVLRCSVCLGVQSDDSNEIIFCDRCGYSVHEGCYGVEGFYHNNRATDRRAPSVDSDTPTELWFCERCASDDNTPIACELCPNTGSVGLCKGTDNGRWVHLICSLSTPGVSFHDVNKLWPVCLSEMHHNAFGSKVCSLCEDVSLSRTGVCITCDVGLCKVSAHAACAYLHGLLDFDPNAVTDAYLFCCKKHTDPALVKERIAKVRQCQQFASRVHQRVDSSDQLRNDRLFAMNKTHYSIRSKLFMDENRDVDTWIKPRPLTSSSMVLRMLDKRDRQMREQSGQCSDHEMEPENLRDPSFTANFVNYYNGREQEIAQLKAELKAVKLETADVTKKENLTLDAVDEFDELCSMHKAMIICNEHILAAAAKVLNGELTGYPDMNLEPLVTPLPLKTDMALLNQILVCAVCCLRRQQDHMIECHNCRRHFHIFCLDPPLKELPQLRSGGVLYSWQCAHCSREKGGHFGETAQGRDRSPTEANRNKVPADQTDTANTAPRRSTRVRKCRKLSL